MTLQGSHFLHSCLRNEQRPSSLFPRYLASPTKHSSSPPTYPLVGVPVDSEHPSPAGKARGWTQPQPLWEMPPPRQGLSPPC